MRSLDIVSPVFNEADGVGAFIVRVDAVMSKLRENSDVDSLLVLVDDGSTDGTSDEVLDTAKRLGVPLKLIVLSKNFGHQAALLAGVKASRDGSCVLAIDSDLQDPPEFIEEMISALSDSEIVVTRRQSRKDKFLKKSGSWVFYRLMAWLSSGRVAVDSGDFWLLSERPAALLRKEIGEKSMFLRAVVRDLGFVITELPFDRGPREAGSGKFTLSKMVKLALAALLQFSSTPMKIALGLVASSVVWGFFGFLLMSFGRASGLADFSPGLVALATVLLPLLVSVNVAIALVVIYLGKVLEEVRATPASYVKDVLEVNTRG